MKNWMNLYFQEVLDKSRLELLPKLKFFKDKWFYLAWWTSLALQYWHRKSIDFDFFIENDIDTKKLYDEILNIFIWEKVVKTFEENNTLYVEINDIKLSFFTYNYKLLQPLIITEYIYLAYKIDISSMKLWAIQNRATNKDYVDLFYLIKEFWIKSLIKHFYQRYWKVVNENLILKSLIYFEDIQNEELILRDKSLNFEKVKEYLINVVWKY